MTKQRSKTKRPQTDAQFSVRLSPEALAYFQDMHHAYAEWAGAGAHSNYANLEGFLSALLEGYPTLCMKYDDALESIERQGADLKFLAAKLAEAGGDEYRVVSVDEVRRRMAAGGGMAAPKGGGLPN